MSNILDSAKQNAGHLVDIRRKIHQTPELGTHLPETKKLVMDELSSLGLEPIPCGDSGVVVNIKGDNDGKVFLLRGDMDALPLTEETGLPFASTNGAMHACGHDFHTTMLLGAAKLLSERKSEINGTVKLMFQPGEEILAGAKEMIDKGLLDNPKVDAAMMIHVATGIPAPSGMFGVFGAGPTYASSDPLRIEIQGKGGHASQPNASVSPILIATAIIEYMQEVVASQVSPKESVAFAVGQIHAGNAPNIIPDTAYMDISLRTFNEEVRADVKKKLENAVKTIAELRGGSAKIVYFDNTPSAITDDAVRKSVLATAKEMLGDTAVDLETFEKGKFNYAPGSEDFAYVSIEVPSSLTTLMVGSPEEGYKYPVHNPRATFNEDCLPIGAAMYAQSAIDWLKNNK